MKQTSVLAHRGVFKCNDEKNSRKALSKALEEGFGFETDIRDLDGNIVVAHNPPDKDTTEISLEELLILVKSSAHPKARIGLNIKSDGLCEMVENLVNDSRVRFDQLFVFDMSIPDSIPYLKSKIPVYTRLSEYELMPAFKNQIAGVWVDNFNGKFPQVQQAEDLINEGIRVTIVSPELHNRDHHNLWKEIHHSQIYKSDLFEICTDLPYDAVKKFRNTELT